MSRCAHLEDVAPTNNPYLSIIAAHIKTQPKRVSRLNKNAPRRLKDAIVHMENEKNRRKAKKIITTGVGFGYV